MMNESFIRKIQSDPDGLDFEGLRKEGIDHAQRVSGEVWTDYNLHDPGVTILEQLCYGLTDLIYRTGFPVADYLSTEGGRPDYERLALYRPDEILPCRPLTANDYRKLILNSIPNTDNVWVEKQGGEAGAPDGLYHIYVQLGEQVRNQDNDGVRKAYADIVGRIYGANRNLCEDLAAVSVVERIPYSLGGEIEIEGKRSPTDILAEIYFVCSQYLSPKVAIHSYAETHQDGKSLDELFTGTLTEHGYIADEELHPWRGHFAISDMIGRIECIEGVKNTMRLAFVEFTRDEAGNEASREIDGIALDDARQFRAVACLRLLLSNGEPGIKLYKAGKCLQAPAHDVETEFNRLNYKYQAQRSKNQRFDWVDAMLPEAAPRNIGEYYSIQNHFPIIYGLGPGGMPDGASAERKAQLMQLKAYLLVFEQLMADYLENMREIPRLFSIDADLRQSYFHQMLRDDTIAGIEGLYRHGVAGTATKLAELFAEFDNHGDRRNRLLDYLLGIYGEKFSQNSLYRIASAEADFNAAKIGNKITFLKEIADIGKNRAAAFNYRKTPNGNSAGLERKLRILLGMREDEAGTEHEPEAAAARLVTEVQIVEHLLLRPQGEAVNAAHRAVDAAFYGFRISVVFSLEGRRCDDEDFRKLAEETVYLNCPAHVHPEVFWLDAARMDKFGELRAAWLAAWRSANASSAEIDAVAATLLSFLLEIREGHNG